jgi:hypothetical protein
MRDGLPLGGVRAAFRSFIGCLLNRRQVSNFDLQNIQPTMHNCYFAAT